RVRLFQCRSEYQKSFRVPRSTSVCPQRGAPPAGLRCDQMGRNPPTVFKPLILSIYAFSVPSAKPRPSKLDSRPQPSQPLTSAPDGRANEVSQNVAVYRFDSFNTDVSLLDSPSFVSQVQRALRWRVGLKGQRSGIQRTEYHRQFSWKKPATAASPILAAEQLLYSGSRCVPPFKKHPIPLETEYRRSFRGQVPSPGPRLREHLEHHQRAPLFHVHTKREESVKKTRPRQDNVTPTQVQRGPRCVRELRLKASSYRRRAWGANFDRDHLSQLLSEHNALWEPTDTTDERSELPEEEEENSKGLNTFSTHCNSSFNCKILLGFFSERSEEGRLPTPRLKMRPVQRTHHDLTTPATGTSESLTVPHRSHASLRESSADQPVKLKEAWSDNSPAFAHTGPSLDHKPATSPASKPIRTKQTSPMAPRPLAPPPPHCIRGTLRNADFQHNGETLDQFHYR
uniref:Nuclear protein MDM1 n=1 Tax=Gasterosteus aculeatus aculeatus TaxID=481459 RepID=A0AAQ4PR73_GASAC